MCEKHCISPTQSVVYHHCESDTTYGWWYTRFDEICSSKRMRYTLKRDDMPLLSQWIKKSDKSKLVGFLWVSDFRLWRNRRSAPCRRLASGRRSAARSRTPCFAAKPQALWWESSIPQPERKKHLERGASFWLSVWGLNWTKCARPEWIETKWHHQEKYKCI